jgi:Putative Ig domain
MLILAGPHTRAPKNLSKQNRIPGYLVLSVVALLAIGTGCSSLNAGGSGSSTPTKAAEPIVISAHLPAATVGTSYSAVLAVSGGSAPYNFALRSGALPPGLMLNPTSGSISGQPNRVGSFAFMVSVADTARTSEGLKSLAITVTKPAAGMPAITVAISPASFALASGATHQFAAQVLNASNTEVAWSASAGTVSSAGVFTAPTVNIATTVQLMATSKADPGKRALATVSVSAAAAVAPLSMANTSLPEATEGAPYTAALRVAGGTPPYRWKIGSGALPGGLLLDAAEGTINGITSQNGGFPFTIEASDAAGQSVSRKLSLNVVLANNANTDGPAELPHVYMKSSLADTPAPGSTQLVKTSTALKAALNSVKCGETIALQAGATFNGFFVLPARSCDDNHWIVLRTSAPDTALPPEGTRATPCYAGVAALPGRPSFGCTKASNVLAQVAFSGTGSGPIIMANGANHYRLIGLEITRDKPKALVYNLFTSETNGTFDHVVIDRSWMHGTAQDETTRGMMLASGTYVAVVDSFFSDFHCISVSGSCVDSQAIAGGLGPHPMGPHKIVNNFLEAAGENVLFGGGGAEHSPEDIEIRRNYFYKPLTWMKGQPGFVGGRDGRPFIVKNHFELKNGVRVLFEGNVLENSWGGFSQAGFSILLTPKNQNNACPICVVHDVTIRYNTITHAGNGFQLANIPSVAGGLSLGMWNVSIHDVVMDDISGKAYGGGGHLFQEASSNYVSVLHDVAINHVTAFNNEVGSAILIVGNRKSFPEMYGFVWSNNIFSSSGGVGTTGGGAVNCAYQMPDPAAMLASCFKEFEFSHNALVGRVNRWPAGNFAALSTAEVQFTNSKQALARYQLLPTSPYAHAGSDGKALGADIEALSAAVAGVR